MKGEKVKEKRSVEKSKTSSKATPPKSVLIIISASECSAPFISWRHVIGLLLQYIITQFCFSLFFSKHLKWWNFLSWLATKTIFRPWYFADPWCFRTWQRRRWFFWIRIWWRRRRRRHSFKQRQGISRKQGSDIKYTSLRWRIRHSCRYWRWWWWL